jgi:uncharacterized protein (TIGR02598 family)
MASQASKPLFRSLAFTLIEVAIALAVVVVVIVSLLALWPSGQDRLRSAIDTTVAAQLARRISAEAELADFSEVLRLAGMKDSSAPAMGPLPRRYFSYVGQEVRQDDPERTYEVVTRVSRCEQLPISGGGSAMRWDARGQLALTIEVVASPAGMEALVGADGLVDRTKCKAQVIAFPFIIGGHSSW